MAQDAFGKITNIAELALIGGILYVGYKLATDLGLIGKKPGGQEPEKPPGTITPSGTNPLLDYVAQQPNTLNPTGTDLSKLTPTVAVPVIGEVGLGIPSVAAGTSAKVANSVSWPIMSGLWEWSMAMKYGDDWRTKMHYDAQQGWIPNSPASVPGALSPVAAIIPVDQRVDQFKDALAAGQVTASASPSAAQAQPTATAAKIIPEATNPLAPPQIAPIVSAAPVQSVPIKSINASDIPQQSFDLTRSYLSKIPNGTPVLQNGNIMGTVENGGVVRLDGSTYYTGSAGQGNTAQGVFDILHPVVGTNPATPAVYSMPGGNVLAGNATTVPKEATVLIPAKPAEVIRAEPITAYVPPPTPVQSIASNPAMGSTPGIVYVNWQNYQVSKVPISGFGWMQMTEAEAKSRGFIK